MTRKPAPIPTTDTTQDLPGVTSSPAQSGAVVAVVAPAATGQGETPKKDRYLSPSEVLGMLAKILPKTRPSSPEFFGVLDAITAARSASISA